MLPYILLVVLTITAMVHSMNKTVHWSKSNPIFRLDNTHNVMDLYLQVSRTPDQLHLVCPEGEEEHVIYSVSKEDFDVCHITQGQSKKMATCEKNIKEPPFTFSIRSFSPTGGMEFKAGKSYYFISTSTPGNMDSLAGGYCSTHNMKLVLNVAQTIRPVRRDSPLQSLSRLQTTALPKMTTVNSGKFSTKVYFYKSDIEILKRERKKRIMKSSSYAPYRDMRPELMAERLLSSSYETIKCKQIYMLSTLFVILLIS